MHTQTTRNVDALAMKYATLKLEKDRLDAQLESLKGDLLGLIKPGDAIETPEYKLSCSPGRSSTVWVCSDEEKKQLQNHLIKKGMMDIKIGDPYIQLRFKKQAVE